jgi:(p)ppGpp synthase/HD superfamily hydrolase
MDAPLSISGAEGMLIKFARCCRPIPGDAIVGFFTTGRGVVVHTADCPNTGEYRKHPDKWVHVDWAEEVSGDYTVTVRVDVENKRGVLANVAATIAEQGSNIVNVGVEEKDGRYSWMRFNIEVKDRVHLARIMRGIRQSPDVTKVARVKG